MAAISGKQFLLWWQQPPGAMRSAIHVALLLLLTYSLAQLTWRLLPAVEVPAPLPLKAAVVKNAAQTAATDLAEQIAAWHLFGEALPEVEAPKPADLPETNLKLTLRGLLASTVAKNARAIVADPSGKENFYKIGDTLPGNAELSEIHADRIVIKRGGRYETLKLPKESLDMNTPVAAAAPAQQGRQTAAAAPRVSYSLREYRDTLLAEPDKVADLVRVVPAYGNGSFQGYKLQPGRDPAFLTRYGLMPGDLITSVNGVVLDSPAKGLGLIKDLATTDTLELEIERSGVRQRFTVPVN